jgi:hypothetical protein
MLHVTKPDFRSQGDLDRSQPGFSQHGDKVPGFYFFRIVWVNPTNIADTLAALLKKRPGLNFEVLDPHTFYALFNEFQGRQGKAR